MTSERLTEAMIDNCTELAHYVLTHKPVPQNLDSSRGGALPPSGDVLDSVNLPARNAGTQGLFQPVPKSQLKALKKLPFLRQRFGYRSLRSGRRRLLAARIGPHGAEVYTKAWRAICSVVATAATGASS